MVQLQTQDQRNKQTADLMSMYQKAINDDTINMTATYLNRII